MRESTEDWLSEEELVQLLKDEQNGRSLRTYAEDLGGISFQNLGMVLSGKRAPGDHIPEALGYEAVTVYRPIAKRSRKKAGRR